MKLTKKIAFASLFCGLMALPVFAGKGVINAKADGEITADEAFRNITGKVYVLEEIHSTFTVSGTDTTDGVFTFEISEGEYATGETPITFEVNVLRFSASEDNYSFVNLGGNRFLFSLDFESVEVSSHGYPQIDGTYTLKVEEEPEPIVNPEPEVDPNPETNDENGCGGSIVAASALVSGLAVLGTVLVSSRKHK